MTIAEVTADPIVFIGSATGADGLRGRISQHIDRLERTERAVGACKCGWSLTVSWAETQDRRSAAGYAAALLCSYIAQHRRMPSLDDSPPRGADELAAMSNALQRLALSPRGAVGAARSGEEETCDLAWSGWHAMNESNKPSIPYAYGVYLIVAMFEVAPGMRPPSKEDPEGWGPPYEKSATPCACPLAPLLPRRLLPAPPPDRKEAPVIQLADEDHFWLHEVRERWANMSQEQRDAWRRCRHS